MRLAAVDAFADPDDVGGFEKLQKLARVARTGFCDCGAVVGVEMFFFPRELRQEHWPERSRLGDECLFRLVTVLTFPDPLHLHR